MKAEKMATITIVLTGLIFILAAGCTDTDTAYQDIEEDLQLNPEDSPVIEDEMETTEQYTDDETSGYEPEIDPEDFVEVIDNPYFPLIPGTTFIYEGEGDDEMERNEVYVTHDTKIVMGVTTTVVQDRVWEDDELTEETFDWYAQDKEGNVWYFGEDSKEYDDGEFVSDDGSWEAGIDGAMPGIVMKADPQIGDVYRQEYLEGEAEDMGAVVSLDESVNVAYGSYDNCLLTREWTILEPDVEEEKYYSKGVGQILEMAVKGGSERLELIDIIEE